jgi:hypothetical protein
MHTNETNGATNWERKIRDMTCKKII